MANFMKFMSDMVNTLVFLNSKDFKKISIFVMATLSSFSVSAQLAGEAEMTAASKAVDASIKEVQTAVTAASSSASAEATAEVTPTAATAKAACASAAALTKEYAASLSSCAAATSGPIGVGTVCMSSHPSIMTAMTVISGLTSISEGVGLIKSCKMYESGMDKVKGLLDAWIGACGLAQLRQESNCGPLVEEGNVVIAKITACYDASAKLCTTDTIRCHSDTFASDPVLQKNICVEAATLKTLLVSSASALETVTSAVANFKATNLAEKKANMNLLYVAGAGLVQLAAKSDIGKKCEEAVAAGDGDKKPNPQDCTVPENMSSAYCTCQLDTTKSNPACPGYEPRKPTLATTSTSESSDPTTPPNLNLGGKPDGLGDPIAGGGSSGSSGGSGGSPTSGGAGGAGGGSSGKTGGGADKAAVASRAGLNTNILSGDGGFGGGGGGGRYGGSGGGDPRLDQFMPGGKNDPNRKPASKGPEIDKAGGKEIFQKVHEAAGAQSASLYGSRF